MNVNQGVMGFETIAFQKDTFFNALVAAVGDLRVAVRESKKTPAELPQGAALLELVKKTTRLTLLHAQENNRAPRVYIWFPVLRDNHIFDVSDGRMNKASQYADYRKNTDFAKIFKEHIDNGFSKNSVDLLKNRVSGFFEDVPFVLGFHSSMLLASTFTNEELAAIVLHELGHAFTLCEYINRCSLTNQVLADIAASYTGVNRDKIKGIVQHAFNLTASQKKALEQCKTPEDYMIAVYSISAEESREELGFSVYDATSCEQLADAYATRCGAGRHLVTALSKYADIYGAYEKGWMVGSGVGSFISTAVLLSTLVLSTAMLPATAWLGVMLTGVFLTSPLYLMDAVDAAKQNQRHPYDTESYRFARIKHQLVQRIKNAKLDSQVTASLIADIEVIEKAIDDADKNMPEYTLSGKAAHFIAMLSSPVYRKLYNSETLQKQLEALASNNLYIQAAKLRTV